MPWWKSSRVEPPKRRTKRRAQAEARRQRLCLLRRAIRALEEPLHAMRGQVEWCAHHWHALERRLSEPEPPPETTDLTATEYSSSLYGNHHDEWEPPEPSMA